MTGQSAAVNPFATLKRYKQLVEYVEPLAVEFWAERQPLKDALVALAGSPIADPVEWTYRLMAAGARLKDAELAGFPAEMADGITFGPVPELESIAIWTAWHLLAAAADGNRLRVDYLLSESRGHTGIGESLAEVFNTTLIENCLAKWRLAATPRYTDRLAARLDQLALTAAEVKEWTNAHGAELSDRARNALRSWLYSIIHGRPIALVDSRIDDAWGRGGEAHADGQPDARETPGETQRVVIVPTIDPPRNNGKQCEAKTDGFFGAHGFRFRGAEVQFGKARNQKQLIAALWNSRRGKPRDAQESQAVIDNVYGTDNNTSDAAFRQLCSDTQRRLDTNNVCLRIHCISGKVWLEPKPL